MKLLRGFLRPSAWLVCLVVFAWPVQADIKIGSTLSITGPASFIGDPEAKTLKLLVDELNANGGVLGQQVELIQYDDGADPNKARTFVTRLIEEDEVVAVIGGSTTGTTMAVIPLFEEAEIPLISLAGAVAVIKPVKHWVFKTPHTDRMACGKIFEDMKKRNISKIGMISGTGGFGKSMRAQCLEVAGDYGIEVVADETHGPKDTDVTPQLTNIKNTDGIQAVLSPGFDQGAVIVTRNYRQLGIELPFYQSHGVASSRYIELSGEAANGVRLPSSALPIVEQLADDDPQKAVLQAYKTAYEEATGETVSTFGGYAHDAFNILIEAIKRAGEADPAKIRDEIEATKGFIGTTGEVNMSPDDHLGLDLTAFRLLEIKEGDWVVVQ